VTTLGFHSPMPPARTGVADYSAALVAALREQGQAVSVGGEGGVNIYHAGNNPLHHDIHQSALRRPGVLVIHDAVLHHYYLGLGDEESYTSEFIYNYGEWNRGLARQLWQGRGRSGSDPLYFEYPMLRRLAESARLVVVHNPGAAALVRAHAPDVRVEEVPHLFAEPPTADPYRVNELRHAWNLRPAELVFGVFGHLRESKRVAAILAAAQTVGARLLVAGDFVSGDYARTMEPLLRSHPSVIRVPFLSDADFWHYARAVDVCINLRYPSAGETSGVAVRLMGIGKAVILSGGLETSRFPEGTCLRVDAGLAEQELLAAYLRMLQQTPSAARRIGEAAREYVTRVHAASRAAGELARLAAEVAGS
jgi:glycosyltransferase involved in cell wall biosynthesis